MADFGKNQPTEKTTDTNKAGPSKLPADKLAEEKKAVEGKKKLAQLGALEDDDEFEEFPAASEQSGNVIDALAKAAPKTDKPVDHLWENNWDDDDFEDDFTKQLRTAIKERNGNADEAMKD